MGNCLPVFVLLFCLLTTAALAGVEEARLDSATERMPEIVGRYNQLLDRVSDRDGGMQDDQWVALGRELWRMAVADIHQGHLDDRSLYWGRLAIRQKLESDAPVTDKLERFEWASRGLLDVHFSERTSTSQDRRRVLITGFDPFLLDRDLTQSNPSGLAALSLDDSELAGAANDGATMLIEVQAVVLPVRFEDFDRGIVEAFLGPLIESAQLDLILTISMGRQDFDLERFPGLRRSSTSPDNRNVLTGASAENPLIPRLGDEFLQGPEFLEFSLPAARLTGVDGEWPVNDNGRVTTLEQGAFTATSLEQLEGQTAVRGSGGGYLSNEVSYRSLLLSLESGSTIPIGHLHTPAVEGFDAEVESRIVEQIRQTILASQRAVKDQLPAR